MRRLINNEELAGGGAPFNRAQFNFINNKLSLFLACSGAHTFPIGLLRTGGLYRINGKEPGTFVQNALRLASGGLAHF